MAVTYRPDYAKFLIHCPSDAWQSYYRTFCAAAHERQYKGDFLKSHKTKRLWFNAENGMETWSLEVWGEWSGIVDVLPVEWLDRLKRFDVRGVVWDATEDSIIAIGQHLQRTITTTNINVYSTKPRSKRDGRDAGGKGFSIGSHKSDLRITAYKRTGEPCAQEYQCSGSMLQSVVEHVKAIWGKTRRTTGPWRTLCSQIEERGSKRMASVFERADIGVYWPTFSRDDAPVLPPIQHEFIPSAEDLAEFDAWKEAFDKLEM